MGKRSAPARLREAATLLPLLGFFLWMPPVIGLFATSGRVIGIPLIIVWLFGVWLALIACALWLSHRLVSDEEPEAGEPPDADAGTGAIDDSRAHTSPDED